MQSAEVYLNIVRDRGRRRLPLADIYPHLYNPELFLLAYAKLAKNAGALTPGTTAETVDGMSLKKIQDIIEALRYERYRWTPVRRVFIEKQGSTKKRPLGIPTWSDKLVQEVIRLVLEAYYEPQFSDRSHGFRPNRGCHSALGEIYRTWKGTAWFIEGDISACFDSLDHEVLLSVLREHIHDNRFVRLIGGLLKAGYLEEWNFHTTHSGAPQGGIVSPILSNIYLDRLDQFITTTLIPLYTRGTWRKHNRSYTQVLTRLSRARRSRDAKAIRRLKRELRSLPSKDMADPGYRRLRYIRYADDFLLGFAGPKAEAEDLKRQIGEYLRDALKLELSETKTLITHGRTEAARFLGYELSTQHNDHYLKGDKRTVNGVTGLLVPQEKVMRCMRKYMRGKKPIHRPELLHNDAYSIVRQYDGEYRGVVQFYKLARNLNVLDKLKWVMETSLTKTLAGKLRISVSQVYRRFRPRFSPSEGPKPALQVVVERAGKRPLIANWSLTTLKREVDAPICDELVWQRTWNTDHSELIQRLLADTCELCGAQGQIEVHHIRALRDLKQQGRKERPVWVKVMASRQRKTLAICQPCHQSVTHGRYHGPRIKPAGEPGDAKVSRPVRRGAVGKVPA